MDLDKNYKRIVAEIESRDLDDNQKCRLKAIRLAKEAEDLLAESVFPYGPEGYLYSILRTLVLNLASAMLHDIKEIEFKRKAKDLYGSK